MKGCTNSHYIRMILKLGIIMTFGMMKIKVYKNGVRPCGVLNYFCWILWRDYGDSYEGV